MGLNAHAQARRALLAKLRDGDPCCRCHKPMYRKQAELLDADHYRHPTALRPGGTPDALAHRHCNRSHGARLKLALHGVLSKGKPAAPRARPVITSRDW